jgi:hypothetical protein
MVVVDTDLSDNFGLYFLDKEILHRVQVELWATLLSGTQQIHTYLYKN